MAREVLIIQTGTANTASVVAGLVRAGADPVLTRDPDRILAAERVVLPGVGALAAALEQLEHDGLVEPIRSRVGAGSPTLAICLGLQLLCTRSEESPLVSGLGLVDADVQRFSGAVSVPQMGWNRIETSEGCRYLKPGFAYFANSYRATSVPDAWRPAWSNHGGPFLAGFERGDVVACQFHPELSGNWGTDLLKRWIAGNPEGVASC